MRRVRSLVVNYDDGDTFTVDYTDVETKNRQFENPKRLQSSDVKLRGLAFPVNLVVSAAGTYDGFQIFEISCSAEVIHRDYNTLETVSVGPVKTIEGTVPIMVRQLLHELVCHEIDECLYVDGERIFDPHLRVIA